MPRVVTQHMAPPPPKAVEALSNTAKIDEPTAEWVVDLEKFYRKQDAVRN